jgi:hypothetical protein
MLGYIVAIALGAGFGVGLCLIFLAGWRAGDR